ncbi:MAG TPA: hypothetical protein VHE30_00690, partial [Polyangiaceae bacterium]|nr:hypothetical protein [Polyangiaceae bacterium]
APPAPEAPPIAAKEETPRPPGMKAQAPPTSAPAERSPFEAALLSVPAPTARPRSGEWKAAAPSPKFEPPRPEKGGLAEKKDEPAASALPSTVKEGHGSAPPPEPLAPMPARTVSIAKEPADPAAPSALPSTRKEGSGRAPAPIDPGATPIDLGAAVITALGTEEPPPARTPSEPPPKRPASDPPPPTRPERAASGTGNPPTVIIQEPARREQPQTLPPKGLARAKAQADAVPPSKKPAAAANAPAKKEDRGIGGFLVVAAVAAVSMYALITAVMGGKPAPAPTPSAPPAETAAPASVHVQLMPPVDLDLPQGITVEAGKGLLEVEAPAGADVLVDSVVVGKGPLARLPIAPGSHEVRIRGEGVDLAASTVVREARRAHLGTTSTP